MGDFTIDLNQGDVRRHGSTIVFRVRNVWSPKVGFISPDKGARTGDERHRFQFRAFRIIDELHDFPDHMGICPELVGKIRAECGSACKRPFIGQHADDVDGILQVALLDDIRPVQRLTRNALLPLDTLLSLGALHALLPLDALNTLLPLDALIALGPSGPWSPLQAIRAKANASTVRIRTDLIPSIEDYSVDRTVIHTNIMIVGYYIKT